MGKDASNATLPTALDNLGLGTGNRPTFSGLNLDAPNTASLLTPALGLFRYGAVGDPFPTDPTYGQAGFATHLYVTPGVGIADAITSAASFHSHLAAGTMGVSAGIVSMAYNDGTWSPDGSATAGSVGVWSEARGSRGGAVYGLFARAASDGLDIPSSAQGIEVDTAISTAVDAKWGVAIVSSDGDSGAVTGTTTVSGSGAVIPKSAAVGIINGGIGATGYHYGLTTVMGSGGLPPVPTAGSLWRAGGYTVTHGLDWPDMAFSGNSINLPGFTVDGAGVIQSSRAVASDVKSTFIKLKNTAAGDAAWSGIAAVSYAGADEARIDFITNSLSNFHTGIAFSTNSGAGLTERARFDHNSGNLLVGTTTDCGQIFCGGTGLNVDASGNLSAYNIKIGGTQFASNGGGYTYITEGSGLVSAIILGPTGDPTNYYDRATHLFRGPGGVGTLARLAAGLQVGTPTDGDKGAGTLNLASALYDNGAAPTGTAGSGYVRAVAPALSSPSLVTGTLTNVPTPSAASDAVPKSYADSIAAGIVTHAAVAAATTANLTATASGTGPGNTLTNSGAQAAFATDGYSGLLNDRILVKNQTNAADNGIRVLTTVGTGATNWVLTRATDFDAASASEVAAGASVIVINGTTLAATNWVETGQGPFTLETTPIVFSQVIGASASGTVNSGSANQLGYYAGAGMVISGLATANNGVLATNGSGVPAISTTIPAATQANITQVGTIATGVWSGTVVANSNGGTGANLSATGGSSNVLKQVSVGAPVTVGTLSCADLSNDAASCATDTTNATNIASGTLAAARLPTFAHTQRTVAADAGTTNTTGLMMGLAGTITPTASGNVRISVCGDNKSAAVAGGVNTQLRTGTGTAPTVGAALTGTTRGSLAKYVAGTVASKARTCLEWMITGLTLNTALWIDVGRANNAGSILATFTDVDIIADEIP